MSQVVPFNPAQLPAHLQKHANTQLTQELAGGVTSGFPVLSYRGKVWRIRKGGSEVDFTTRDGDPIPSVELIFLKANPRPSKIYYAKRYEEGSNEAPSCWSADGIKPDSGVQNPVSASCASCPNNVWGSRITEAGKKSRLCSDTRRMAVSFANEIETKGEHAHVFLMRIPPASLNPLKDYGEKVLGPKGIAYYGVVTKVGFDPQASHPKLTFRATRFLTEEEFATVEKLRDGTDVRHILAESVEFDGEAGTTGAAQVASVPGVATPAPVTKQKAVPAPAASRLQPVEDENVVTGILSSLDEGDEAPTGTGFVSEPTVAPTTPAPATETPKRRGRKPKVTAQTAIAEPVLTATPVATVVPAAAVPSADEDEFDAMLKGILGD